MMRSLWRPVVSELDECALTRNLIRKSLELMGHATDDEPRIRARQLESELDNRQLSAVDDPRVYAR